MSRGSKSIAWIVAACAALVVAIAVIGRGTVRQDDGVQVSSETITMVIPTYGYSAQDTQKVFQAMNAYSLEKCGVQVNFLQMDVNEIEDTVGLRLRAGEEIDLFPCMEGKAFRKYISEGMIIPLDALLESDGSGIMETVPDEVWPSMMFDGKKYGVSPIMLPTITEGLVIRKDVCDALGLDPQTISAQVMTADKATGMSTDMLTDMPADMLAKDRMDAVDQAITPVFEAVLHSDEVLANGIRMKDLQLACGRNDYGGLFSECQLLDADGFGNDLGMVQADSGEVANLYETTAYRNMILLIRKWAEMGLIYIPDTQADENSRLVVGEGKSLGNFSVTEVAGTTVAPTEGVSDQTQVCRIPLHNKRISTQFMQVGEWVIPAVSQHKEAAMKILNLMFSDKDYVKLFDWGIEGEHYQLENGQAQVLSEQYFQNFGWMFGNILLLDDNMTQEKLEAAFHQADYSPYYGFTYDEEQYEEEISAMEAVLEEYIPQLETGQAQNPEQTLAEMNAQLHELGLDQVMQDKQTQLDAWLAAKR